MGRSRAKIKMMEDGISLLPDCSLVEIISRLDSTEEAIRTSILSKRWKHLWTQVPVLNFIHTSLLKNRILEFISYIEKVMSQRGQSKLNKFKLHMAGDSYNEPIVSKLISYAVTCNVQDFDLFLGQYMLIPSKFVLDQSFFINSDFKHLKLGNCLFDNATGVISWSNLKLLSIARAKLDEDLVKNILSGSPLLETLYLISCHGFGRIDITSPSIKKLVVSGYGGYGVDGYIADILEIYAPHILSLTIEDELMLSKVVLLNVSSLDEASLDYWMNGPSSIEEQKEMFNGQIVSLRHVKKLKIGFYIEKLLDLAGNYTSDAYRSDNDTTDNDWSDDDSVESED